MHIDESRHRLIAFYLPQFHPIPENDAWWGKGFTEWDNVVRASPLFPGHYQPHLPADLGFYDLRLPEARQAQADLAREYGVYGFCYYHYWFSGRRLLDRPFAEVLASGQPDFPFCLCWANENWTRAWDGREQDTLLTQRYSHEDDRQHIRWLAAAFRDERYIRVNGRPLLLVYRATELPKPQTTTAIWREEALRMGLGELYLCRVESLSDQRGDPESLGYDAAVEFQPDWTRLGKPLRDGVHRVYEENHVQTYSAMVEQALQKHKVSYTRFPCVAPGWDNSPRRRKDAIILRDSTPEIYESWLRTAMEGFQPPSRDENLVFINAWNEWAEGAHLEPCKKWGRSYLEATSRAIKKVGSPTLDEDGNLATSVSSARDDLASAVILAPQDEAASAPVRHVKLSVCIPTYNGAPYVEQAISSVLGQTFEDFELIVVDDCSSDGTRALAERFNDDRIRVYENPSRLGLVGNWNRCLELSAGEYVCIFHQDDVMAPENLEAKVHLLDEKRSVGFVFSDASQIDRESRQIAAHWFGSYSTVDRVFACPEFFAVSMAGVHNLVCCPTVMVRRECYRQLGGFDSRLPFTADWEMWLRIGLLYDAEYIARPLVRFRSHASNETLRFRGSTDELRQYWMCKMAILEKSGEHIRDAWMQKQRARDLYGGLALGRALLHSRRGESLKAEGYLGFLREIWKETGSSIENDQSPYGGLDYIWQGLLEGPWDLTAEELSQRISFLRLVGALHLKIAARPGLGWLHHNSFLQLPLWLDQVLGTKISSRFYRLRGSVKQRG